MHIYRVYHVNPKNDDEKPIGVYCSEQEALEVIEKYKRFEGFKDSPDCFYIDKYELDKTYWTEGYYSVKVKMNKESPSTT